MSPQLERLLADIEADATTEAATPFIELAARYLETSAGQGRAVSTRQLPAELAGRFTEPLPEDGMTVPEVAERLQRDVVDQSNWLYHPRYMGHQVSAPLPIAVWTEALIGALNQSVAVQEMSPAITMIEMRLIRWLCETAGLPDGSGTLTSGGTEATFTALSAARAALLPNAWESGMEGPLPVVLCGEHAHYAVTRAVAQLGLGLKRALPVRTRDYRMDVGDLRARLQALRQEGTQVMAVVATAGSTATGSFDDLNAVADACDEFGCWLHVDGAHGASALFSNRHRVTVAGIERARSIAWDPHKMMLMPLSLGVVLLRNRGELDAAFRQQAPYLFTAAQANAGWDQGARSFQCSRRADALKLWAAVQRYGTTAFGLLYDHFADLANYLYHALEKHPGFEPLHRPECNILCFRYTAGTADDDDFNLRLRTAYNTDGTGWITTTMLDGRRVLRVTLINPRIRYQHLDAMVAELSTMAARLRQ